MVAFARECPGCIGARLMGGGFGGCTVNLVEKPGAFLKDKKIRNTVFRYMLFGRKKNAAARIQRGASRDDMIRTVCDPS